MNIHLQSCMHKHVKAVNLHRTRCVEVAYLDEVRRRAVVFGRAGVETELGETELQVMSGWTIDEPLAVRFVLVRLREVG